VSRDCEEPRSTLRSPYSVGGCPSRSRGSLGVELRRAESARVTVFHAIAVVSCQPRRREVYTNEPSPARAPKFAKPSTPHNKYYADPDGWAHFVVDLLLLVPGGISGPISLESHPFLEAQRAESQRGRAASEGARELRRPRRSPRPVPFA
jgi:hypothetical protein